MIRSAYIDNFKSLVGFHLPQQSARLGKFTCLIGANGSGKSTILQALDFTKQLMIGRMDDWLEMRGWNKSDLSSCFTNKKVITIGIEFDFQGIGKVFWLGEFNPSLLRCTKEVIRLGESKENIFISTKGIVRYPSVKDNKPLSFQGFEFQGSALSALRLEQAHPAALAIKYSLRDLKSLDMLAPNLIRRRNSSSDAEDIGYGGERMSAFLHGFSKTARQNLLEKLRGFYPQAHKVESLSTRAGWKELQVVERFGKHQRPIHARQLNDGLLRILAILSQVEAKDEFKAGLDGQGEFLGMIADLRELAKNSGLRILNEYRALLFDEIENGIHPELIEKLIAYLLDAQQQIIVTTHSPMILNYLPDEVAKEAVILLYRTQEGITRSVRYFDLPSARKKLDLLGPGEVFADTDLTTLAQEAEALRNTQP